MISIGQIVRGKPGPIYEFHPTNVQPWSWLAMIREFKDDVQRRIVGDGLVSIKIMPIPNTYDHKRAKAQKDNGTPYEVENVPVWDFVVLRGDGTQVRFHPDFKGGKVTIASMEEQPRSSHPKKGKGASDGKGTFKRMVKQAYPGGESVRVESKGKGAGKDKGDGNAASAHSWQ